VGKVVQPLQNVNCHDTHAHGHERHGPFTQLVGLWWFGSDWVTGSSWFGSWYAAGARPVSIVLGLAIGGMPMCYFGLVTGGMPVSIGQFGYGCDSCELVALGYSWVTLVQFMLTSYLGLGAILCN
jgi:hypothetical protein